MLTIKHPLPPGIPGQIERLRDWLALPPSLRGDGANANAVLGEVAASHARLLATVEALLPVAVRYVEFAVAARRDETTTPGGADIQDAAARIGRAREALMRAKGG